MSQSKVRERLGQSAPRGRRIQDETVAIGYCHPVDSVGADFHVSMVKLLAYDFGLHQRVKMHLHLASGANITNSRNEIVRQFLKYRWEEGGKERRIDWLWMVDADMDFEGDTVERLVHAAHPTERPLMGGLCFALDRGEGSPQEIVPTLYTFIKDSDPPAMVRLQDYPRDEVVPVAATGAACILMHRSVLEDLDHAWAKNRPWNWYQETVFNGEPIGEDVTFCLRAGQAGYPIYVDTSIQCGHTKPFRLNQSMFDQQFAGTVLPTPTTRRLPTYVVIPVKDRLDLTQAILTQLEQGGDYAEIMVFDNGSTDGTAEFLNKGQKIASAFDAAGANIYAIWNEGIREAQRLSGGQPCNVAILNNDLVLGAGFLQRLSDGLRSAPAEMVAVCGNYDGRTTQEPVQPVTSTFKDGGFAGFAFMVKGECIGGDIPYFDERYTWYFGDDDFVHQVHAAGGQVGLVGAAKVQHIGGGSQSARNGTNERLGTPELRDSVARDTAYYTQKWIRETVDA